MEAGTARIGSPRAERLWAFGVPAVGVATIAGTLAYGWVVAAGGHDLGTPTPPLLYSWRPEAAPYALAAAAVLVAGVAAAQRLRAAAISARVFALGALVLGLVLRLAVGAARGGVDGWWAAYQVPGGEGANEYLPALPALQLGTRFFLDTFAEIGTALPAHAVGHPPGLLVSLHFLGIDTAEGMSALTIGVGALSVPLVYLLARGLLDEARARTATLLYVFAPSAVLHGAASADALYATVALLALIALLARSRAVRAPGPMALALASFLSYANLGAGAFAALVSLRREGLRRALALSSMCALALVAFYGLVFLATGFDVLGAVRSAESVYREGVASGRPYAFWVLGSPVAFLVAAGLPLAWLGLRALGARETVALALFAVLAVSAILGFTKAETERIYLFLVPLLCLAAATALPERRLPAVLAALAAQALATELLFYTIW